MSGMIEDMERRIDEEKALQQRKRAQEAQEKAKAEAKKLEAQRHKSHVGLFF